MEIPSGIIADLIGKKPVLLISRIALIPAYLIFSFTSDFFSFMIAMVFLAVNKSFKSGTHKAYIFDYLKNPGFSITPTEVYGKCKFWARIGEAAASVSGGYLAVKFGYESVFVAALFPSVLNIINTITYADIEKNHSVKRLNWENQYLHLKNSIIDIFARRNTFRLIINSALFIFCIEASEKFLQPYMKMAKIDVKFFGIIYMVFMVITAFATRYAYKLENHFKRYSIVNFLGLFAVVPFILLGSGIVEKWGVSFFLLLFLMKNLRRPVLTSELNESISSSNRATILSITALTKSLFLMLFLPVIGYISDNLFITDTFILIGIILLLGVILLRIFPENRINN